MERMKKLGWLLVVLVGLQIVQPAAAQRMTSVERQMAKEVVRLVNKCRAEHGLSPLTWDERIVPMAVENDSLQIAMEGCGHMKFHARCDKLTARTGLRCIGENAAFGYESAAAMVDGWMHSPGHRANILEKDFNITAVSVKLMHIKGYQGRYVSTQSFASNTIGVSSTRADAKPLPKKRTGGFAPERTWSAPSSLPTLNASIQSLLNQTRLENGGRELKTSPALFQACKAEAAAAAKNGGFAEGLADWGTREKAIRQAMGNVAVDIKVWTLDPSALHDFDVQFVHQVLKDNDVRQYLLGKSYTHQSVQVARDAAGRYYVVWAQVGRKATT